MQGYLQRYYLTSNIYHSNKQNIFLFLYMVQPIYTLENRGGKINTNIFYAWYGQGWGFKKHNLG